MASRFQGPDGRRRQIESLLAQRMIQSDQSLAEQIVDQSKLLEVKKDDAFINQGDEDNSIFFILQGTVEITVNGRYMASREAGTYVGEMALIDHAAKRSATIKAKEDCVLLSISEEKFSPLAKQYPHLWRHIASELGSRLRQRGSSVRPLNEVPELFIGSSVEQLAIANVIQSGFSYDKFSAIVWTNGVFGPSKTPIENLMARVDRTDFAVFVLGDEDIVISHDEKLSAPRDNIIFELGLFIGRIGRERVFLVKKRGLDLKIPTDLLGVGIIDYSDIGTQLEAKLGPVCTELRKEINILGPL